MNIYKNQNFKIGISTTKTLFKIKNLHSGNEFSINVNDIKKAFKIKENLHFNKSLVLNRTLYFLDQDLKNLNIEVLNDKKQFNSICKLQDIANDIRKEFFNEYYLLSMFKNTLGI
jgi:hypothetical protein